MNKLIVKTAQTSQSERSALWRARCCLSPNRRSWLAYIQIVLKKVQKPRFSLRIEAHINGTLTNKVSTSAIGILSQMPNCPMTGVRTNKGISTKTMLRHTAMTTLSNGRSMAVWKLLATMLTKETR